MEFIDPGDQQRLLTLARRALEARVRRDPPPAPERGGAMEEPYGAFVTIHWRGELRGCLGQIEPKGTMGEAIARLAASVADSDPRFGPVSLLELSEIDLEISVLGAGREIRSIAEIEIGRHGVIVEQGARRGLLLPQVAAAHGWSRETLVSQTCRKAALPPDAWRAGTRILVFEAHVFGEVAIARP